MDLERYRRQVVIPEIGEEGQHKLAASSVLVVGAGGLAARCSMPWRVPEWVGWWWWTATPSPSAT